MFVNRTAKTGALLTLLYGAVFAQTPIPTAPMARPGDHSGVQFGIYSGSQLGVWVQSYPQSRPAPRSVEVFCGDGVSTLHGAATANVDWISLSVPPSDAPQKFVRVHVYVNANHLAPGTHNAEISVTEPTFQPTPKKVPVRLTVLAGVPPFPAHESSPELKVLAREAESELATPVFSVMHKKLTPSSGDKHDYMSVGPYWWPDPSKPDGLPYIRKDGERNPERNDDRTDSTEIHRMFGATQTLMLAYHETKREEFAKHAAVLLRAWFLDPATQMNPNLNYGQAVPGRVEGRGTGIIDTAGLVELTRGLAWIEASPSWTRSDQEGMKQWFAAYLDWLLTTKNGKEEAAATNNHGTWYDAQVVSLALATGNTGLAKQVLADAREKRIDTQINEDGSEPLELERTNSFSYSLMNTRAFFELATMADRLDLDLWHTRIHKAIDFLAPYVRKDKTWPYQQIDGVKTGNLQDLATLLRRAAYAYDGSYELGPCYFGPQSSRTQLLWPSTVNYEVMCH